MSPQTILLADDDKAIRTVVGQALIRANFVVKMTGTASTLWNWVQNGDGDLIITDIIMPDENGLDLIPRIHKIRPNLRVIVMSAENTVLTALRANESGAFEYLPKPFDLDELVRIVRRGLESRIQVNKNTDLEYNEQLPLIGRSQAMQQIYRTLGRLISTDLSVMISGESGTGKELVAKVLHDFGKRKNKPFVAVNMAAIPKELIESELFGHEKGAFTGATARVIGRFESANGGTLFLDEIGDMPMEAQTRLLRVLQEGEFTSIGGQRLIATNVRIISATNQNLKQRIRLGYFREDLFFRLNVVPIQMPPLRERSEDIPELVQHFLTQAVDEGLPWKTIDKKGIRLLQSSTWSGNVRELKNLVRRLVALYSHENLSFTDVQKELEDENSSPIEINKYDHFSDLIEKYLIKYFTNYKGNLPPNGLHLTMVEALEKPLIIKTLEATHGNQIKAAQVLGLNRNTLRKKMHHFKIEVIKGAT